MRRIIARIRDAAVCASVVYLVAAKPAAAGIGFVAQTHVGFFVVGILVGALAVYLYHRFFK